MNRAATRPADLSSPPSAGPSKPTSLPGRFVRAGLALGICAMLGAGILGGSHAATSRHSVTSVSIHLTAQAIATLSPNVTGGPGNE